MNEIATALTSIKTAIELAKILKDSSITLAEAEQKLKLAEIISALAVVKLEMADMQTLLMEKDARIRDLQECLKIKGNLVFEGRYYWLVVGDKKDGPFCQCCYDSKEKLIRLQQCPNPSMWRCNACTNVYG
jgi:hypothetical protein